MNNNNRLTQKELQKFKELLLAKRNELLGNVNSMEIEALRRENGDLSKLPIHMADLGTDNYDQEFTLGLMDSERKLMKVIDEALDRIENGTYGICEGTGKPIPKARLEAIPWARYCVEYAWSLEKGLVREKDSFIESVFSGQTVEEQDENSDGATEYESD
jgi:RNA polymerase-binding protein DksA